MISTYIADLKDDESVAFTRKNKDGTYTIVLNGRYSHERLQEAYEHELKHIKNGDLEKVTPIQEAELRVRGLKPEKEPKILGMTLIEYRKKSRQRTARRRRRRMKNYNAKEADYYPDGAYEEMIMKGWI